MFVGGPFPTGQKVKGISELTPCADFDIKCYAAQSSFPPGSVILKGQWLQAPDRTGCRVCHPLEGSGKRCWGEMRLSCSPGETLEKVRGEPGATSSS